MRDLRRSALGTTVVTLTSLMGNGRTTAGRRLAERLHKPLVVDEIVAFLRRTPERGDEVKS